MTPLPLLILANLLVAAAAFLFVLYGLPATRWFLARAERGFETALVRQLLIDVKPRQAVYASIGGVIFFALIGAAISSNVVGLLFGAALGVAAPFVWVRHLEQKRKSQLERQLVDGITTMASAVRAGLNLVQAMELVVTSHRGPIQQEFGQLMRESQLGMDLNQAMRIAANRIGSSNFRLLFTALEMHRVRGGDVGTSLDRIAESIREIQRLEGKLDAVTSQGRFQAWMMAVMPLFFLFILYLMDPEGVTMLFVDPLGRVMLMVITVLIGLGYLWIRKIMAVDI